MVEKPPTTQADWLEMLFLPFFYTELGSLAVFRKVKMFNEIHAKSREGEIEWRRAQMISCPGVEEKRPFRDNFASIMPLAHLSFLSSEGNERLRTDAEDEKNPRTTR